MKRQYIRPEMLVTLINCQMTLLAGSESDLGNPEFPGIGTSRRQDNPEPDDFDDDDFDDDDF